jgi:hypothetical protein
MASCGDFNWDYCAAEGTIDAIAMVADDTVVIGRVMEPGQTAYFVIEAFAGAEYEIQTTDYGLTDPILFVYARDGATILDSNDNGGDDLQSRIVIAFPTTDPYIIGVQSASPTGPRATGATGVSAYVPPPTDEDTCSPNPCQHGAACFAEVYRFHCTCIGEWMGATCSVPVGAEEINMCAESGTTINENCGKLAQIVGQLFFIFKDAVGVCSVRE